MMRPDARELRRIVEELRYHVGEGHEVARRELLEDLATMADLADLAGLVEDVEALAGEYSPGGMLPIATVERVVQRLQ